MIPGAPHPFLMSGGHWESHHKIGHSVRLRNSASAYFSRVFGAATALNAWTWHGWIRPSMLPAYFTLLAANNSYPAEQFSIRSDTFQLMYESVTGGNYLLKVTNRLFRDPTGWLPVTVHKNGPANSGAGAVRIFVGLEEITSWAMNGYTGTQALVGDYINSAATHQMGRFGSQYADGGLAGVKFIDGLALLPEHFLRVCPEKGHLEPIPYVGAWGNNGSFPDFSDGSAATSAALGKDRSGNNNDWTPNNISVAAGVNCDWVKDSPTDHYPTLSPLDKMAGAGSLSDGNLTFTFSSTGTVCRATTSANAGEWFAEMRVAAISGTISFGLKKSNVIPDTLADAVFYRSDGQKIVNGAASAYGAAYTANDVIAAAPDMDVGSITFYKQTGGAGPFVSQGAIAYSFASGYSFAVFNAVGTTVNLNFGQRDFEYVLQHGALPAGHKAQCAANEPEPPIVLPKKHFDAITYIGDGNTSKAVTGAQFQPDLVWAKNRTDAASDHSLHDIVRGVAQRVRSNSTAVENTEAMQSFDANGFTVLAAGAVLNVLNKAYVAWLWKAGGAPAANNAGSVASQVSANALARFSVVAATLAGSNQTIGHGLPVAPKLIIGKRRNGVGAWAIAFDHAGFDWASDYYQFDAAAKRTDGASNVWRQAPTSSVFSVGANFVGDWIFYCFAEVPGFSKLGMYVGNGSADGAYVHCGFRPRYVLVKQSTPNATSWWIHDAARNTYNVLGDSLQADAANAESPGNLAFDFTSGGFKCRNNWSGNNTSGSTYIFAAFAEAPGRYANAR